MCIHQEKIYVHIKSFQNSTFDDMSVIGIPEVFMNIMYCHDFVKEENTMVILA